MPQLSVNIPASLRAALDRTAAQSERSASAVVIDALARFIPGVLGEEKSLTHESFTSKLLDFPQYTRPAEFRGMSVPEILLSGDHAKIEKWRHERSLEKTRQVRPDLLK